MIHVFHGLFGSQHDFSFLKNEKRQDVKIYDLYSLKTYPKVGEHDTLIGYSLGGRMALEIGELIDYQCRKIVLINSHPGLSTIDQIVKRTDFENTVIHEMKTKTKEEFFLWWNSLPLFKTDKPIHPTQEIYEASVFLFEKYRLSKQKNHLPQMIKHKEKILYIVARLDEVYMKLSEDHLKPHGIRVHEVESGHRAFQHPDKILKILITENIL